MRPSDEYTRPLPRYPYGYGGREPPPPRRGPPGWAIALGAALAIALAIAVVLLVITWGDGDGEDGAAEETQPADGGSVSSPLSLDRRALEFETFDVGTSSEPQAVVVSNTSAAPVDLGPIELLGENADDFTLSEQTTCEQGATLDPLGECIVAVVFAPSDSGARTAAVTMGAGEGGESRIALRGTGAGETVVRVAPRSVTFPPPRGDDPPETRTVTVTNTASEPIDLSGLRIEPADAGFKVAAGTTCVPGARIAGGDTCAIDLEFDPDVKNEAPVEARLTVVAGPGGAALDVALRAEPQVASLTIAPGEVDFGEQEVGERSPAQEVRIENTGSSSIDFMRIELTGTHADDFILARGTTCTIDQPLGPERACTIAIRFEPAKLGEREAILVVEDSAEEAPTEVPLFGSGEGAPTATLGSTSIDFGGVERSQASQPQTVTITNEGNAPLRIARVSLSGPNVSDFAIADGTTCRRNVQVAPEKTCVVAVVFTPGALGNRSARLAIEHDADGSPSVVALAGQGTGEASASVDRPQIDFGTFAVGSASGPAVVLLRNTGNAPMTVAGVSVGGTNPGDFPIADGTTCVAERVVKAQNSCRLVLVFAPTAAGPQAATVVITHDAPGGQSTVELAGTGQ